MKRKTFYYFRLEQSCLIQEYHVRQKTMIYYYYVNNDMRLIRYKKISKKVKCIKKRTNYNIYNILQTYNQLLFKKEIRLRLLLLLLIDINYQVYHSYT